MILRLALPQNTVIYYSSRVSTFDFRVLNLLDFDSYQFKFQFKGWIIIVFELCNEISVSIGVHLGQVWQIFFIVPIFFFSSVSCKVSDVRLTRKLGGRFNAKNLQIVSRWQSIWYGRLMLIIRSEVETIGTWPLAAEFRPLANIFRRVTRFGRSSW